MTKYQLQLILSNHAEWLKDSSKGKCASLSGTDLSRTNLSDASLREAYLSGADLREAYLSGTDLSGANLSGIDLSGTNLSGANLSGATLWDTVGNRKEIKSLQLDTWSIAYTKDTMQIGCQRHLIADWWKFDDDTIAKMEPKALAWWHKWKPVLAQIIATTEEGINL